MITLVWSCRASDNQSDPPPAPAAMPLDSAARAEQASYDSALRRLGDSVPAVLDSAREMAALEVHMRLARLGYIGGPFSMRTTDALRAAIRRYERARGLPETGDPLTWRLTRTLQHDLELLDDEPTLPSKSVYLERDYASVEGAWQYENAADREAERTAVKIWCDRRTMTCEESMATLRRFGGSLPFRGLSVMTETWAVTEWDDVELTARSTRRYPCARYTLRINRVQASATRVRSTTSVDGDCAFMTRADIVQRLVAGSDLAADDWRRRRALWDSVLVLDAGTRARLARADTGRAGR